MDILFFPDQATDYRSKLKDKLHQRDIPSLTCFLERATAALQDEVTQQPRLVRGMIPGFSSIADLLERIEGSNVVNSALESAICTICQISCLICYLHVTSDCVDESKTRIIGSCTGLLAAIAASTSPGLSKLPILGATLVRLSFRIGVLVEESRQRLQHGLTDACSWSKAVAGSNEEEITGILRHFHEDEKIPLSSQAYISAVGAHSLTISGPPSVLKRLETANSGFNSLRKVQLPIHGPYHAGHLYSAQALERLVQPFNSTFEGYVPRIPLFSSSNGKPILPSSTLHLVKMALGEILREPLRWDRIVEGNSSELGKLEIRDCKILSAGPADVGKGLSAGLQRSNSSCSISTSDALWASSSHSKSSDSPSGRFVDSKIAIVGMAGRFPNAANHELFWELLEKGTDTHRVVPKDRFDESHIDPTGRRKNTSHTPYGCFIDEPGLFDPRFFRMSPREATQTDPMHRLAILTAYEALEMSGYVPNRTPSTRLNRIGTFYGQTSDDWREIQEGQDIDTYFIPGGVRAFAPGRINYYFKFSGPSFSVDTACSSSFAALQLAVTSLRAGDVDTAVTGGMNVLTNPDIFSGLSRGQFLSKTGNCQTFDNEADGYCRGEAVASVILKRLEDAENDKDNILGIILASATNHSADAISITHPHAPTQEYLYKDLLNTSALEANQIGYVEMHGTGTQAGDHCEMESVTNVFADPKRKRSPEEPLYLGAVKANIGHGEAASGVCALIKVLLMMEKNAIPPNCGIKRIMNQSFPKDLEERQVKIPLRPTPWLRPAGDGIRRVFVSNFSAAGGNTGVIMEDGPSQSTPTVKDSRSTQIVAVSGKSKSSLRKNLQQLIDFIDYRPSVQLPSLSYTTTARRIHHNYRIAAVGSDVSSIRASLSSSVGKDIAPIAPAAPDIAFVFTGQGAHYPAMGRQFFEENSQFRSDILQFDDLAQSQGFPSFKPLIDGSLADIAGLSPVMVQLGSVCVQMALARLWASWNILPTVVLGHSLGEYAALNAAGVLSASDTIYLVGKRAQQLENTCIAGTHAMLAVAAPVSAVEPYMDPESDTLEIACINSSVETVLGGISEQIEEVSKQLLLNGFKSTKLRIPFAFHVSQVDPILENYETIASGVTFNAPSIPVISPLLGEVIKDKNILSPNYLRRHARETVNFPNGLDAGFREGVLSEKTLWVEVGPHPVCLAMVKKMLGPSISAVPSLRRSEDAWRVISAGLASLHTSGLDVDWHEFHRDFNAAQRLLRLPTYAFDFKNYWIDYTGNWCLTKGDVDTAATSVKSTPKMSTTSVHKVVEENCQDSEAMVIIESDVAEPTLRAAVKGHMVNGTALCPSSLYADMALTVADYLHKQLKPQSKTPAMSCGRMEVDKPLIATGDGPQLLRVQGTADIKVGKGQVNIRFYSVTSEGKKKTDHAKCTVAFVDTEAVLLGWQRYRYLIKPRIETLLNGVMDGTTEKIRRNMAYALFGSFVQYGASYRGMEEVVLNADEYEATAKVAFQTTDEDGTFTCSPYWIDSVGHLSGFVLNVKEALGDQAQVFVSHGWDAMCFARPLSKDKTYRSYVKMQPVGGKMMAGDVVLFEEDEIIGVIHGLRFQCIPRTLLNTFLPPAGSKKASAAIPAKKAAPTATKEASRGAIQSASAACTSPKKTFVADLTPPLNIIAEEVGVPISELSENVVFEDMGVDSLMSLTILARLREELDLDLGSDVFVDCPTVADFLAHVSRQSGSPASMAIPEPASMTHSNSSITLQSQNMNSPEREATTPATSISSAGDEDMIELIRTTIAEEMGVPVEEIVGATDLASLGMDSLMSLTILANLRETTGQDLSSDFFVDNPSIAVIEETLCPKSKPTIMMLDPKQEQAIHKSPSMPSNSRLLDAKATSLLLQGSPRTADKTLFLFPDGSGSATSYASIAPIGPSVAVYGLNCPFMKTPHLFTCGIDGIATLYMAEVLRRQPKGNGPYYLGGWSAGGVVAYEVACQLIAQGEKIARLILLDAPCPIRLEPLPSRLHHFFDEIGLLGTGAGAAPEWLLPHFEYSIKALDAYRPTPMSSSSGDPTKKPEKVFAVWARDGVCGRPEDPKLTLQGDDPKSMRWLLENRTDFGSNGWEGLLGGVGGKEGMVWEFAVVGCNHFTMMRLPAVKELAALIKKGLE